MKYFQRAMAFGAVLAMAGCAAPAPPQLLKADGVERASVDSAAFRDELASFRNSAFTLGDALLASGGEGNVVASPGSLLIAPTAFTHTHRGNRPQNGDKFIATSWILFQSADKLFGAP